MRVTNIELTVVSTIVSKQNTEQQLPKYICDNCAKSLDVAYEFKRKYEDSIVKYIRRSSYQDETPKIVDDSRNRHLKMYSEYEDRVAGEQQETMQTRAPDVPDVCYTVVNLVEQEIDIEEMDIKPFVTSLDIPLPSAPDERINRMAVDSNANEQENGTPLNQNVLNDEIPEVVDGRGTVEGPLPILCSNSYHLEIKSVNFTRKCGSNSEPDASIEPPENSKTEDEATRLPDMDASQFKPANNTIKIWSQAEFKRCPAGVQNHDPFDAGSSSAEEEKGHTRFLRSNSHQIETFLSRDILRKIYTSHHCGIKPFKCDVCFRWFKTKGHIKAHRLRHIEGEKKIKCRKCLLTFLTKPHYHNHRCHLRPKVNFS